MSVADGPVNEANGKSPTIIVKAGNPALPFVLSVIIGLGAFWWGTYYERAKYADYSVRVSGVPDTLHMEGAPSRIDVSGQVEGIPKEITFKGTSVENILPKEIQIQTAAIAKINDQLYLVVTPQGGIFFAFWTQTALESLGGQGHWAVTRQN